MATRSELRRTRRRLRAAWEQYVQSDDRARPAPSGLRAEIATSWDRSAARVPLALSEAPVDDPDGVREEWERSPLRVAVSRLESELHSAAVEGDLAVAVSDPDARIMWACQGSTMRPHAEGVNFVPGGRWDEHSVGTNALDLALRVDRPVTVYSAEHFSPFVHNWTCWAAPIHDPATGAQLGVVDLSTTWDKNHTLGYTATSVFARLLEQALPVRQQSATTTSRPAPLARRGPLELRLLGRSEARLDGLPLLLTPRQMEILALLALHPEGLRLDALHAHLYGDRPISLVTVKVEISRLRNVLGDAVASRPYRLAVPVRCDAAEVLEQLRAGRLRDAAAAYGGRLLPGTEAPGLIECGDYLEVAVREALLADPDPDAVLRYVEAVPYDTDVLETAIAALDGGSCSALPLLRARLANAYAS
jgi:hypothetical protein